MESRTKHRMSYQESAWLSWYKCVQRCSERRNPEATELHKGLQCVIAIATNYQGKGVAMQDLVGAGNLGLAQAMQKYDRSRNAYFLTYARSYIYGSIWRELKRHKPLTLIEDVKGEGGEEFVAQEETKEFITNKKK